MTSFEVKPVVVVLTALDLEYQAVLAHLTDVEEIEHPAGTLFEVGRLAGSPGFVAVAVTTAGSSTAAALAERAITMFRPEAVLFIGVAGALHDGLSVGDVVVATRVYSFHGGRVDSESQRARPRAWDAPHDLEQRARSINRAGTWTRLLMASAVPAVWFAPVAAGEVVLDSRDAPLFQWLREHFNDAVAIEMEGAGVVLAGHINRSVPVLVVRGISDRADGRKSQADAAGGQPTAAAHAAAFGLAVAAAVLDRTAPATPARPAHSAPQAAGAVSTRGSPRDRSEQAKDLVPGEYRLAAASAAFAVSVAPPLGLRDPRRPLRGRDKLVEGLFNLLMHPESGPRVQVLHGLGGCGKTSVALELAALAAKNDMHVWWVRAANHRAVAAYMQAVAREVGATNDEDLGGQLTDVLWQRLEAYDKRWLLVIDGANEPTLLAGVAELADGTGWIRPHSLPGLVVVTTRDGSPDMWGSWCSLRTVDALTIEDATDVLLDYAPPQAGTRAEAADLANRLGGLPLALRLTGSYLAETSALPQGWAPADTIRTFATYHQALDAGRLDVLTGKGNGSLIDQAWEMSMDLLRRRNMPQANSLLSLLSMFADAPIPYETLLNPDIISRSPLFRGLDGAGLWRLLRAAADLGLIGLSWRADPIDFDPSVAPPVLRLHPLVRDTGRHHVVAAGQEVAYVDLANALLVHAAAAAGSTPEDPLTWSHWQVLAPHAFQLLHAECTKTGLSADTVRQIAGVATLATRLLFGRGLYRAADVEFRFLLDILIRALGEEDTDTLAARHGFASLLHDQGLYGEAEREFRAVIRTRTSILGKDHPHTLVARNELAQILHDSGQRTAAEEEFRSILSAFRRVLGDGHPTTFSTRYDLARVLHARAEHDEAEREFRAVLGARRELLGDDHPDTLVTRSALAYLHHGRGQLHTAESEFRSVLEASRRTLGEDHPKTLATRNNLARVLHDLGHLNEAVTEFKLVLEARRQVLGAHHPNTLTTQQNLARILHDLGRTSEAETEFRAVLEAQLHVLGRDHPDTVSTQDYLTSITEQGRKPPNEASPTESLQ